jgi:hypothetical protein
VAPPDSVGTIFFVHRGPLQAYVRAAILQAREADSGSNIVVMGDHPLGANFLTSHGISSYGLLGEYKRGAMAFERVFRFEGRNPLGYTLGNFQRWFAVHEYCDRHQIEGPILVLDSDAFLYLPISEVTPHLTTDMTVVDRVGPQFTFFRSRDSLTTFTKFLSHSFRRDSGFQRLKDFITDSGDAGLPHVSDMAAFGVYARDNALDDLGKAEREDFVFCENIGSPQGLVMNTLGKRVSRRRGRRYFTTRDGRQVLSGGVHLQGGNKVLWPFFVDTTVRKKMKELSALDYQIARSEALDKVVRIGLLKSAARVRKLVSGHRAL